MHKPLSLACIIALSGASTLALAQAYPNKPIRIVVPYPAGGPIDMTTRPLAQKLTEAVGNPVVVDNRAGANGIIGTDNVAKSPPDGYSLVVASGGGFAIGPHVYAKLPFDVFRDFAPVSLFVTMPELLAVHPALPVKSVKELVALARARPNQLNFGSSGTGSTPQLAAELLKSAAKIQNGAYSVQRHGAGNHGSHRRPAATRLCRHAGALAAGQRRQAARACGRHAAALAEFAGRIHDERSGLPAGRSV